MRQVTIRGDPSVQKMSSPGGLYLMAFLVLLSTRVGAGGCYQSRFAAKCSLIHPAHLLESNLISLEEQLATCQLRGPEGGTHRAPARRPHTTGKPREDRRPSLSEKCTRWPPQELTHPGSAMRRPPRGGHATPLDL